MHLVPFDCNAMAECNALEDYLEIQWQRRTALVFCWATAVVVTSNGQHMVLGAVFVWKLEFWRQAAPVSQHERVQGKQHWEREREQRREKMAKIRKVRNQCLWLWPCSISFPITWIILYINLIWCQTDTGNLISCMCCNHIGVSDWHYAQQSSQCPSSSRH